MSKKILNYSQETMAAAIDEVRNGSSVMAAAKKFGVPRVTLLYKVNGKLPVGKKMGPATLFTGEQEKILAEWVITMAKAGFPVTKDMFMISVAKLSKELDMEKPPGEKWYKLFRGRNIAISDRIYQTLTRSRANVTKEKLIKWFEEVGLYMQEKGLMDVLKDASRVFNADESAFYLNPRGGKVLAERGSRTVYLSGANDEKENVTVLMTANAAGQIAPPMVVYRYKRIPMHIAEAFPEEWAIGRSENGWMTHELFYEYIVNIFYPWLKKQNIALPVVFFLDGHSSHISLHLSQFCVEHGIELVALYPNATHILQPMDVAVFHTLKAEWRKQVQQWRMSNLGEEMKKKDFPPLLQEVIGKLSPSIFENGFRKCGLMPWNPQAVCLEPDQPMPPTPRTNAARVKDFLSHLEHEIGQQKLLIFRNNKGEWSGNKEDLSLYNIWKSNKDKLEEQQIEVQRGLHTRPPIPSLQPSMELVPSTSDANEPEEMLHVEPRPSTSLDEQEPRPSTSVDEPEEMVSAEPDPSLNVPERLVLSLELSTPQKAMEIEVTSGTSKCHIPSPFKKTLFWPGESAVTPKRMKKEKIPAVLTSPQMMAYYKKKEEGKQKKYDQQVEKKKKREETKKALEEKKRARADKKKVKDQEKQKKQQKENEETDSISNCSSVSFRETDDSDWHEDSDDLSCQPVTLEGLKEGDFVLCEFKGGRRNQTKFVYLCIVQEKDEAEIQVMGLKSQDERKTEFTVNENDISSISIKQVLGRLDLPKISSKGE